MSAHHARITRLAVAVSVVLAVLVTGSCAGPFGLKGGIGRLEVGLIAASSRSITPDVDLVPMEYRISGSGPSGDTFATVSATLPATVAGLVPGRWIIQADGYNAAGDLILVGSVTVNVAASATTAVTIRLEPTPGVGDVEIEVTWPAALAATPSVEATLHSASEEATALTCGAISGGSVSCSGASVKSGWYRLELLLHDGGAVVAGQVELLAVVAGKITHAQVGLVELNKPGMEIAVQGATLTIAWDPPPPETTVAGYNLYYRPHGTYVWQELAVGVGLTEHEITPALLAYGTYDFAVTSVSPGGIESEPHTSLDDTASPQTGWYVRWTA